MIMKIIFQLNLGPHAYSTFYENHLANARAFAGPAGTSSARFCPVCGRSRSAALRRPHRGKAPRGTPAELALSETIVRPSCAECHLNKQTDRLSGHPLRDTPPEYGLIYPANITQDPTCGIGAWTDAELESALRTGIARNRRYLLVMPHYAHLSDGDITAVLAFLHSAHPWVQADPTATSAQQPSLLLKALANTVLKPTPLLLGPLPTPTATQAVAYGHYLVTGRYLCFGCHSKNHKSNSALHPEESAGYMGGGTEFRNAQGQPVRAPNITGHAAAGIGWWTPAQLAVALRYGHGPQGLIYYPMPKYPALTDEEIRGIYAYLQSVLPQLSAQP